MVGTDAIHTIETKWSQYVLSSLI